MNDVTPETVLAPGFPKTKKVPDEIKVILAKPRCKLAVTRDKHTVYLLISKQVAIELISEGFEHEFEKPEGEGGASSITDNDDDCAVSER